VHQTKSLNGQVFKFPVGYKTTQTQNMFFYLCVHDSIYTWGTQNSWIASITYFKLFGCVYTGSPFEIFSTFFEKHPAADDVG
jgi:hypothetical protein